MKTNGVATTLKTIGIIEAVCGIFLGLILLGELGVGSIVIMIASFITCMIFVGFAEIINLLQKNVDSQADLIAFLKQQPAGNYIQTAMPDQVVNKQPTAVEPSRSTQGTIEPPRAQEEQVEKEQLISDEQQKMAEELRKSLSRKACSEQMKLFLEQASRCSRALEIEELWKSYTWENRPELEAIGKNIHEAAFIEKLYGYSPAMICKLLKSIENAI